MMAMVADPEDEEVKTEETEDASGLACALDEFQHNDLVLKHIRELDTIYKNASKVEQDYEQFMKTLDLYQEKPSLLTSAMKEIVEEALDYIDLAEKNSAKPDQEVLPQGIIPLKHLSLKYLRHVFKVYRPKKASKFMPHEITNVVPVLELLESISVEDPNFQDSASVLVYWLSVLVMNPFGLKLLDGNEGGISVTQRIVDMCMRCIVLNNNAGKAAPVLIAKFLTRPDTLKREKPFNPCEPKTIVGDLESFISWACQNMTANQKFSVRAGAFGGMAAIFKQGNRADICVHGKNVLDALTASKFQDGDTFIRKLGIKLLQRVGMTFLKARIAHWRYDRGNRSLLANLKPKNFAGNPTAEQGIPEEVTDDSYEDLAEYSDEIETILDILLNGLDDKDFVVRWSAAKGVARIVNRIPKAYADEIIDTVLKMMVPTRSSGAWAGACLALAELGKKGLLLPARLPEIVDILQRALMFEEVGGGYSGGRQVRDCACYVAFAFARCFEKEILKPYLETIATTLILVALFDREVTCRRAGAAAFQENVGRHGNFPHGQEVAENADYITVASRVRAYTEVSVQVAKFEEYPHAMLEHLTTVKYCHRDPVIRELTATSIDKLATFDPDYMVTVAMDKLTKGVTSLNTEVASGAIMSVSSIVTAFSDEEDIEESRLEELCEVLHKVIRSLPHLSVQDNILLREALNFHIYHCGYANEKEQFPRYLTEWITYLQDSAFFNHKKVQTTTAKALGRMVLTFFRLPDLETNISNMLGPLIEELISPNETRRLGAALAVESIITRIGRMFPAVGLKNLILCATLDQEHAVEWIESRRTAISALGSLLSNGFPKYYEEIGTASQVMTRIREVMLAGLKDYTSDRRGDVGSMVREKSIPAAMILLRLDEKLYHERKNSYDLTEFVDILAAIARQCVEKIDNLRIFACNSFLKFLRGEELTKYSGWESLVDIFLLEPVNANWKTTTITFKNFARVLFLPELRKEVLTGLIITGGSLGGTNQADAVEAIYSVMANYPQRSDDVYEIAECIIGIFNENVQVERISVPLMKCVKLLLERGLFQSFTLPMVEQFGLGMINCIKMEISKATNVDKIIVAVDILLGLFEGGENLIDASLKRLIFILCHPYPRVRKLTAEKMMIELPRYEDEVKNSEAVVDILEEVRWEAPLATVRPKRDQICELLNIPVPVPISTSKSATTAST